MALLHALLELGLLLLELLRRLGRSLTQQTIPRGRAVPLARGGPTRCAYCHDALGAGSTRCPGCATALHPECLTELLRCPTAGCAPRRRAA